MNDNEIRKMLVDYARRGYDRGLVGGTGGNFSARLNDGVHMLITPSGVSLKDTTLDNLVTVHVETHDHEAPDGFIPSKEFHFHADIYRIRPDIGAVAHMHPPFCTAFAVKKRDIPYVTDAAFKQPPMPHVAFAPSGTPELRNNVATAVKANPVCRLLLMEAHGIAALGIDVPNAYDLADLAEEMARIAFLAERLGNSITT
jgi:ribulose-5-phosphate 4-epimerase/fuculose-1-phosphate aldolase